MKKLRVLLLPLSWLYGLILWLRNIAYNLGLFKTYHPDIKTIAIGNIALGGTGKTPHIEYIILLLKGKKVAVLSRGYGRESEGTILVRPYMTAILCGDEPLQIARKFPQTPVVVDHDRRRGIQFIQKTIPEVEIILLDDALQHRKIAAGLNIVLTTFQKPFYDDHYLPAGNLRDHKIRAKDANLIIVTKCPQKVDVSKRIEIKGRLNKYSREVVFDKVIYKSIIPIDNRTLHPITAFEKILVVTGIASPIYFLKAVKSEFNVTAHFEYSDHYSFKASDLARFRKFIGSFAPGKIAILTTEKDAMRLLNTKDKTDDEPLPIFYWEIGLDPDEDKTKLDNFILDYASQPE